MEEEEKEGVLDWNHKVNQLVGLRVAESKRKVSETPGKEGNYEEDMEKETEKLIKRKLHVLEEDTWPCPYCEKVCLVYLSASTSRGRSS